MEFRNELPKKNRINLAGSILDITRKSQTNLGSSLNLERSLRRDLKPEKKKSCIKNLNLYTRRALYFKKGFNDDESLDVPPEFSLNTTPLHCFLCDIFRENQNVDEEVLKAISENYKQFINSKDYHGQTPLHIIVSEGYGNLGNSAQMAFTLA
eukprot:Sdes_comp16987_c0_seq1m6194